MKNTENENKAAGAPSALNVGLCVFLASYSWSGGYGAYENKEYVVVANTASEALGMVLEAAPETKAKHWSVERVETDVPSVNFISSRES